MSWKQFSCPQTQYTSGIAKSKEKYVKCFASFSLGITAYCKNIGGLIETLHLVYYWVERTLFIDLLSRSLKAIFLIMAIIFHVSLLCNQFNKLSYENMKCSKIQLLNLDDLWRFKNKKYENLILYIFMFRIGFI